VTAQDALQTPVVEGDVEFPRLEMDDLVTWAGQIKAQRKTAGEARINADKALSPFDRNRALRQLEHEDVEIGELAAKMYTPGGIVSILRKSLTKGGKIKGDAEIAAVLKRIHYSRQQQIAAEIMSPPDAKMMEATAVEGQGQAPLGSGGGGTTPEKSPSSATGAESPSPPA
jgi:3,4-dihydroxy-2-butanone 4-phosphate synthase